MAEVQLLGLFHEAASAAEALDQLRQLGVPDGKVTVMSGTPYTPEMLGRPKPRHGLGRITLTGSVLGLLGALFLTAGIFLLYQLNAGGQPLIPIPPSLIVFFEVTMLGTMGLTFVGLWIVNGFPNFRPHLYDKRITEGALGVVVTVDEALSGQAEAAMKACGAFDCLRAPARAARDTRNLVFWGVVALLVVVGGGVLTAWAYDVIKIPIPDQMVTQPSVDYEDSPRLAAPVAAIPVQGPDLIDGQPATEPLPATSDSLQRGRVLFGEHCALCHGAGGTGNGLVAAFMAPVTVADLTSPAVQGLPPSQMFVVITQGFGNMPPLAENLSVTERWDVINFIRTLKK